MQPDSKSKRLRTLCNTGASAMPDYPRRGPVIHNDLPTYPRIYQQPYPSICRALAFSKHANPAVVRNLFESLPSRKHGNANPVFWALVECRGGGVPGPAPEIADRSTSPNQVIRMYNEFMSSVEHMFPKRHLGPPAWADQEGAQPRRDTMGLNGAEIQISSPQTYFKAANQSKWDEMGKNGKREEHSCPVVPTPRRRSGQSPITPGQSAELPIREKNRGSDGPRRFLKTAALAWLRSRHSGAHPPTLRSVAKAEMASGTHDLSVHPPESRP